jgi:hypothetical protein
MKLATIKQIKDYIDSDPSTWKKKDKDLKHKDREDNIMFKAYYWVIIKYLKIREERKEIKVLKKTIKWFEKQIKPHDCSWMHTTINGLQHRIDVLENDWFDGDKK